MLCLPCMVHTQIARVSSQGWIDRQLYDRIVALLRRARLPLTPPSSMTTPQVGEGCTVWVRRLGGGRNRRAPCRVGY